MKIIDAIISIFQGPRANTKRLIAYGFSEENANRIVKAYSKVIYGSKLEQAVIATGTIHAKGFLDKMDYYSLVDLLPIQPRSYNAFGLHCDTEKFIFDICLFLENNKK